MSETKASQRPLANPALRAILTFAQLGTLGVLAAQAAGLLGRAHFFLDLANHPQFQYFIASFGACLFFAIARRWRWILIAAIAVVWSGLQVLPWYWGHFNTNSNSANPQIRMLISNVLSDNRNITALRELIAREQPDVVVMIEADGWWIEKLTDLRQSHPHGLGLPRQDNFGIAVFSKLPMSQIENHSFESMGVPSIIGSIEVGEQSVKLIATHPLPPSGSQYFRSRNAQLQAIAEFAERQTGALIVAGDLNITMWSPIYRDVIARSGLHNARDGFGILPSWPTGFPSFMRIPIDHCLHTDDVQVLDCRLAEPIGSDHLPLIVDLNLRGVR